MKTQYLNKPLEASDFIALELESLLKSGDQVLWLVSGGSSIQITIGALELISKNINLESLNIGLIDERFGGVGHKNSNWQQLLEAGLNKYKVNKYPILKGLDTKNTAVQYSKVIASLLNSVKHSFALLGVGQDSHTAGLLPHNPIMSSANYYDYYNAKDYTRVSSTPTLLRRINKIALYAYGVQKGIALDNLTSNKSIDEAPIKILKDLSNVTIYTNIHKEDIL